MNTREQKLLWAGAGVVVTAALTALLIRRVSQKAYPPLQVVPDVDLTKYSGEWYEIARLPVRFEKNCGKSKASYAINADGKLEIVNTCYEGGPEGKVRKFEGKAFAADPQNTGKLKVQYFWPFTGDYHILSVGSDYEYAMVGTPDRKKLWILSRLPELHLTVIKELMDTAETQGFDTSKLMFPHLD